MSLLVSRLAEYRIYYSKVSTKFPLLARPLVVRRAEAWTRLLTSASEECSRANKPRFTKLTVFLLRLESALYRAFAILSPYIGRRLRLRGLAWFLRRSVAWDSALRNAEGLGKEAQSREEEEQLTDNEEEIVQEEGADDSGVDSNAGTATASSVSTTDVSEAEAGKGCKFFGRCCGRNCQRREFERRAEFCYSAASWSPRVKNSRTGSVIELDFADW
jgi:hypothetical protein